jgi:hypothetical protein
MGSVGVEIGLGRPIGGGGGKASGNRGVWSGGLISHASLFL